MTYESWKSLCTYEYRAYIEQNLRNLKSDKRPVEVKNVESTFYTKLLKELIVGNNDADIVSKYSASKEPNDIIKKNNAKTKDKYFGQWNLLKGVQLYNWQEKARDLFLKQTSGRGIVQAVTGSGKTILAFSIIQELKERHNDLCVLIIVPKVVLMEQWYQDLIDNNKTNLDLSIVGRLGGGYKESFADGKRIIVAVVNSLFNLLINTSETQLFTGEDDLKHVLLIADECHRYTSEKYRHVLNPSGKLKYNYVFGISATPEREGFVRIDDYPEEEIDEDDQDADTDDESINEVYVPNLTEKFIGKTIFNYDFSDAIEDEVIPLFTVHHHGIKLQDISEYNAISLHISNAQQALSPLMKKGHFLACVRRQAKNQHAPYHLEALRFLSLTLQRRFYLYQHALRYQFTQYLLKQAWAEYGQDLRCIIFHETIEESMMIWKYLVQNGIKAVAHNSALLNCRDEGLELFRKGEANIVCSAKTLIEGVNIPEAHLGIVSASNSSPRQRIQTIGRLLRRDPRGFENRIHIQYFDDTIEERIYSEFDWDSFLGKNINKYYTHELVDAVFVSNEADGPPCPYQPKETELEDNLTPGQKVDVKPIGQLARLDGNVIAVKQFQKYEIRTNYSIPEYSQVSPSLLEKLRFDGKVYGIITYKRRLFISLDHETNDYYYLGRVIIRDTIPRIGLIAWRILRSQKKLMLTFNQRESMVFFENQKAFELLNRIDYEKNLVYMDQLGDIWSTKKEDGKNQKLLTFDKNDYDDRQLEILQKYLGGS